MSANNEYNEKGEVVVLGRKAVDPYPKVFWIVFLAGFAYLLVILVMGSMGGHAPAHH